MKVEHESIASMARRFLTKAWVRKFFLVETMQSTQQKLTPSSALEINYCIFFFGNSCHGVLRWMKSKRLSKMANSPSTGLIDYGKRKIANGPTGISYPWCNIVPVVCYGGPCLHSRKPGMRPTWVSGAGGSYVVVTVHRRQDKSQSKGTVH